MTECELNIDEKIHYNYNTARSTISQIFVILLGNIIMLQFGMSIAMSTVVNGELMRPSSNSSTGLHLTPRESSWYGSLLLIFHPLGSVLSSVIQDRYGRRKCLTLVAIPEFLGWTLLYFANSSILLCISTSCLGLAMGLSEAPILTYIGECIEPRMRSGLASFTVFCSMIGVSLTFNVAAVYSYRQIAFIYQFLPSIVFFVTIFIIPESPVWLLSRLRKKEATKALCWLRGFADASAVRDELISMENFIMYKGKDKEDDLSRGKEKKYRAINKKKKILGFITISGPFIMFNIVFVLCTISAMIPVKPYLRNVMDKLGLGESVDTRMALAFVGNGSVLGAFCSIFAVKLLGKRRLLLLSIFVSACCQFLLGLYAMGITKSFISWTWLPLPLFCAISFTSSFGINPIPWILLGEIFPMKTRGKLSGVSAALNSVFVFCVANTYWDFVSFITLPWVLIMYATIATIGMTYIYFNLPETENKTLQQIQEDL